MKSQGLADFEIDQNELLSSAIDGDLVALEKLLILHVGEILGYVKSRMPAAIAAHYDPDDVLQDVCFEACRRIGEFSSKQIESFVPWLLKIARHQMITLVRQVRSQKRGRDWRRRDAGDDEVGEVIRLLESLAVFYRTPSASAMAHEVALAVQRSIDRLPPDHNRAIRLRHIEGMSAKDAAAKMNRTEGAFHLLCNRGLKRLREDLKSKSGFI